MNNQDVIVITGGAGGIGTACAKATDKDQLIIITDYSQEAVDQTVTSLNNKGYQAKGIAADITSKADIEKLVKFVKENGKLKALIHTAGVSGTVHDLKKVFTIDLVATDMLLNAFFEIIEENAVAILLSSMMAHIVPANEAYDEALANPQAADSFEIVSKYVNNSSDVMYNFAKRGVQLLTHKYANQWGSKGARLISVSPGVIETPMALKAAEEHPERMEMIKQATPLKRNGTPEDIAGVIQFLTTDAAQFINSTDIRIDGGVIHNIKNIMQPD